MAEPMANMLASFFHGAASGSRAGGDPELSGEGERPRVMRGMNTTKHVPLLTGNIFGRGFDSRSLHTYPIYYKLVTVNY